MSIPRRAVAILIIAGVTLAMAGAAVANFSTGIYRTKPPTSRVSFLDFSFRATSTRAKQVRYDFRKPNACNTGATLSGNESPYTIPPRVINNQDRFRISVPNSARTGTLTIQGRLIGRTARGTLRVRATFSNGPTCDTGNLAWRALRLG